MARLKSPGVTMITGAVRPSDLREAIENLELKPLTRRLEQVVLFELGCALGEWWDETQERLAPKYFEWVLSRLDLPSAPESAKPQFGPATAVTTKKVARRLVALSNQLKQISEALSLPEEGLHEPLDQTGLYARGGVAMRLEAELASDGEPGVAADAFLDEFCTRAGAIARACDEARTLLTSQPGKPGTKAFEWFDHVAKAAILVCEANDIKPTVTTDRDSGARSGQFIETAERLEQLLPAPMRSGNLESLNTRWKRSRERLRKSPYWSKRLPPEQP